MKWMKYNKALVSTLGWVIACVVAMLRDDDPEQIHIHAEMIAGVLTTLLVYFIPNKG